LKKAVSGAALVAALAIGAAGAEWVGDRSAPHSADEPHRGPDLAGDTMQVTGGASSGHAHPAARDIGGAGVDVRTPCPPELLERWPWLECVLTSDGRLLSRSTSSAPVQIVPCPVLYTAPGGEAHPFQYEGPCTSRPDEQDPLVIRIYDRNGVNIGAGTS